jgi:2-polyprenyl-3-methyl-5-hydroxy-6-metoxy-1,4-benzoquinol methylase
MAMPITSSGEIESYWNQRFILHKEFGGVGYLGLGENYNRWLYRVRRHIFLKNIKSVSLDFSKAKILDIGSGAGFYIGLWQGNSTRHIVGSDISDYAISRLKSKYSSLPIKKLDISENLKNQGFSGEKFDVISAFDILFHIVDEDGYINSFRNISEILNKNGYFIFSENFSYENKPGKPQSQHKAENITALLAHNKLRIIKKIPMFVIMNYPINSKNALWLAYWRVLEKVIGLSELSGWLIGAFLFPIEIFLLNFVKFSYSTSMVICQKE